VDFVQLRYFKTLAELQHMTHAAKSLHIAQPALSRALRKLEQELGLLLFDRDGKNIRLNENGVILLKHADNILNELDEAKRVLADRKDQTERQVSVAMYAGTQLLPDIIRSFKDKYPDISLLIMQQQDVGVWDMADKCDILIHTTIQPLEKSCCLTLIEEELCLAMPKSHPLSLAESIKLSQVAKEPFIGLHKGSGLRTITDEYCRKAGFLQRVVVESDSPGIVRNLISLGVGLAFIPKITWKGVDYGPNVSLVDIEEPHCIRYIHMTWRQNRYVSTASKIFQSYLAEFFAEAQREYSEKKAK